MASPVALLTSAKAGMPSSSLTPVQKRVLVPVLVDVLGVGRGEHDGGAVANGEAVVLVGAAEDLEHLQVGARRRGSRLVVVVVVPEPRHLA